MSAKLNCSACEDLRQNAPNFVINGFGDDECTSLANNTGLSPSSGHDDFTDLNNMDDCLIGNMEKEIDSYNVCDWKTYMKRFADNVWTMFKAIICAIRGLWTKTESVEQQIINMPKDIMFADVEGNFTVQPGYPDEEHNRINIPATRTDGYVPVGVVGWNLSNRAGDTGVSRLSVFKVKLMSGAVSIQIYNNNSSSNKIVAEATVLYVKK